MRRILFAVGALIICLTAVHAADLSKYPADRWGRRPVKIYIAERSDVYRFPGLGVSVEELRDGHVEASLTDAKLQELIAQGWRIEPRMTEPSANKGATGHHNYVQMTAFLDSIHALYPAITRKFSIGQSVNGRELWAFLISDHPDSAENEAEVRLAANIHGDEVTGREMCLAMVDSLTRAYATVPAIADLVNNREIWFMPALNPDGYELVQRGNANGEDLNRDFPVPDGGPNDGYVAGTEIEVTQFINFWAGKRAVLSFNYHGGALVANYPWDYTYTLCPDDALAREVSLGYARLNPPMYASTEFDSGVTNGAAWYVIRGGLQDWSYHATSCLDVTMEISTTKWPSAGALPGFWSDNRGGMLYFIKQAGWGVQGVVTDSLTGLPINRAQLDVAGIAKPVYTDSIVGDYHRMLMTGYYDLTFSKPGYASKTFDNVRVRLDSVANLDVQLSPIVLSGTVSDSATALPIAGAVVTVVGVRADTTDAAGHYSIQAPQGTYDVSCAALGYGAKTAPDVAVDGMVTLDFALGSLNQFGYEAHDTINIPDNGAWIVDSIYVDRSVAISDYRAYVNITHTYKGDLAVRLFHPGGDSIRLHQRSGGAADNIIGWYPDAIKPADSLRWGALYGLNAPGWWTLKIKDFASGYTGRLNGWALEIYSTGTGVAGGPAERPVPVRTELFYGRPNPLRDQAVISYQLGAPGRASLKVYNAAGQLVRTLEDGPRGAGHHSVSWDGRDDRGAAVSAGVYLYRLVAGGVARTSKLVVVR
ncbi:T9SS type A sorting domain-containing protein [bacterium]|nr:T9SS type A sorting domain-containing protein [bacterium]